MNLTFAVSTVIALGGAAIANAAFVPQGARTTADRISSVTLKGYLDDLSKELYQKEDAPDVVKDSREYNTMNKQDVDRYGPGTFEVFQDFEEFDGGDGQMGVAGDGRSGLEKDREEFNAPMLAKDKSAQERNADNSKMRSARNAWGTFTGYADKLREQGVDTARAQQLENWANQQEVLRKKGQMRYMTEEFDKVRENAEADWRTLAKFGVERNEKFDLNEKFGPVKAGEQLEGTIELKSRIGSFSFHELSLKNPFMGFADFRAAFTSDTSMAWTVKPNEGSISKSEPIKFILKFKPESLGTFDGYLVIETEDFKKTWRVIGSTG